MNSRESPERTLDCADGAAEPPEFCLFRDIALKPWMGDDIPGPVVGYSRSPMLIWLRSVLFCSHKASMICSILRKSLVSLSSLTSMDEGPAAAERALH